jgi:hypothetical protein
VTRPGPRRAGADPAGHGPSRGLGETGNRHRDGHGDPGISKGIYKGTSQLRIDNIWFCKLLLLFTVETKIDAGMKKQPCAFVSVLEEYKGHRRPGLYILHIFHIIHLYHILHMYILHIMPIMILLFYRMG